MKNKLLKSSAFVLALSSSLWNQSEAMGPGTWPIKQESDITDCLQKERNSLYSIIYERESRAWDNGQTCAFQIWVCRYRLGDDGGLEREAATALSMVSNPTRIKREITYETNAFMGRPWAAVCDANAERFELIKKSTVEQCAQIDALMAVNEEELKYQFQRKFVGVTTIKYIKAEAPWEIIPELNVIAKDLIHRP
ncbi:MAG: hypothetical protein LBJ45_01570 [Holosporaceae bacterium]|nr:hypothetical protein [Holosporaceae bacterium]